MFIFCGILGLVIFVFGECFIMFGFLENGDGLWFKIESIRVFFLIFLIIIIFYFKYLCYEKK